MKNIAGIHILYRLRCFRYYMRSTRIVFTRTFRDNIAVLDFCAFTTYFQHILVNKTHVLPLFIAYTFWPYFLQKIYYLYYLSIVNCLRMCTAVNQHTSTRPYSNVIIQDLSKIKCIAINIIV